MRRRYVLEYVRDGVIIRHQFPAAKGNRLSTAKQFARVFAARLPVVGDSWGKHIGWIIRVKDRETGLYPAAYERRKNQRGRSSVRAL